MVKAVVGDEAHLKAFEEALSSSSSPPPQAQVARAPFRSPPLASSIDPLI
jgi:hypothetical protein